MLLQCYKYHVSPHVTLGNKSHVLLHVTLGNQVTYQGIGHLHGHMTSQDSDTQCVC